MQLSFAQRLLHTWRSRSRAAEPRLRLVETLPLGGKRYLALVECDGHAFLLGGKMDAVLSIAPAALCLHEATAVPPAQTSSCEEQEATPAASTVDARHESNGNVASRAGMRDSMGHWLARTITFRIHRGGRAPAAKALPAVSFADVLAASSSAQSGDARASKALDAAHEHSTLPMEENGHGHVVNPTLDCSESEEHSLERELIRWASEQSRHWAAEENVA